MTIERSPQNLARDIGRQMLPKVQPKRMREPRPVKKPTKSDPPKAVREAVLERARLCCERCGIWSPPPVGEVHHRRNRSQGLDNSAPNLVLLCKTCHAWCGARPKDAHAEGFHLERGELPAKTKLHYGGPYVQEYGRRWARLREDGEVILVGGAEMPDGWDESEVLS